MRISNQAPIQFKLIHRIRPNNDYDRERVIVGYIQPDILSNNPEIGNTTNSSIPFRNSAIVPSLCVMYKKIGDTYSLIPISALPYRFIRLLLHGDYDYKQINNLKYIMDTLLYNDRIQAVENPRSQSRILSTRGTFELLKKAALFINTQSDITYAFNLTTSTRDVEIIKTLNRYKVSFLYDNVDDFNSFLLIRYYHLDCDLAESWKLLLLRLYWDGQSINTNVPNVIAKDPFSNYYALDNLNYVTMSMLDDYKNTGSPLSYHISGINNLDVIFYKVTEGITNFGINNLYNNIASLRSNIQSSCNNTCYCLENSILYYLDYNPDNNNISNIDEKTILGIGFIHVDSVTGNDDRRISFQDSISGRNSLTNTSGVLYEHHTLTAFLRFMILYCLRDYDILWYSTYNTRDKAIITEKRKTPVHKTQIYDSSNLEEAKNKIKNEESIGFRFYITPKVNSTDYTISCAYSLNDEEKYTIIEKSGTEIKIHPQSNMEITEILTNISKDYSAFIYIEKNMHKVLTNYLIDIASSNPGNRIILDFFNFNSYIPPENDPFFLTDNSSTRYIEYTSAYYPNYWYYDDNGNKFPEENSNLSSVPIIQRYMESNHPALIVSNKDSTEIPKTKRGVKNRHIDMASSNSGNAINYYRRIVRYMELKDPVSIAHPHLWDRLKKTQVEAVLPIDLETLNTNNSELQPPVINTSYMKTDISNFVLYNLITSGDINEYPVIPSNLNTPTEIDTSIKLYYREVLYWKYIRYIIISALFMSFYYPTQRLNGPDILFYQVEAVSDRNDLLRQRGIPIPLSMADAIQLKLQFRFYDNRIIDALNITMIIT